MHLSTSLLGAFLAVASTELRCPTYAMKECAGRGACVNGACACMEGFGGPDCAIHVACDPEHTRLPCKGRGTCNNNGECKCAPGYSGALCATDDWCPSDRNQRKCSGVGVCDKHRCLCPSHTTGVSCEIGDASSRRVPSIP